MFIKNVETIFELTVRQNHPSQQNIKSLEARLQKLTVEQEMVSLELEKLREEQRAGLACRA